MHGVKMQNISIYILFFNKLVVSSKTRHKNRTIFIYLGVQTALIVINYLNKKYLHITPKQRCHIMQFVVLTISVN